MKTLITLLLLVSLAGTIKAQDSPRYEYCQIQLGGNANFKIWLDLGDGSKDQAIKDFKGDPAHFNSLVTGMNYLSKLGWEYVESYNFPVLGENQLRFIFKRKVANNDNKQPAVVNNTNGSN